MKGILHPFMLVILLAICSLVAARANNVPSEENDKDCVTVDSEEYHRCAWISIDMMRLLHMTTLASPLNVTAFREKCMSFEPCVNLKQCEGDSLRKPLPRMPTMEQSCDAGIFLATDFWNCALKLRKGHAECVYLLGHPPERPRGMYVSDKQLREEECRHAINEYNCLKVEIPSKCGMRTWLGLKKHLREVNLEWKDRIRQKCSSTRPY